MFFEICKTAYFFSILTFDIVPVGISNWLCLRRLAVTATRTDEAVWRTRRSIPLTQRRGPRPLIELAALRACGASKASYRLLDRGVIYNFWKWICDQCQRNSNELKNGKNRSINKKVTFLSKAGITINIFSICLNNTLFLSILREKREVI